MKLLKPLLFVFFLSFIFSCTSEDENLTDQKENFDKKYLLDNKEFATYNELFIKFINEKKNATIATADYEKFEEENSHLMLKFYKNALDNTNFLDLDPNKIIDVIDNSYNSGNSSQNKSLYSQAHGANHQSRNYGSLYSGVLYLHQVNNQNMQEALAQQQAIQRMAVYNRIHQNRLKSIFDNQQNAANLIGSILISETMSAQRLSLAQSVGN